MTRYTLTFLEDDYEQLQRVLSTHPGVENAAYILCRQSKTPLGIRLLVREVIATKPEHLLEASAAHMKIASASFRSAMKRADELKCGFGFVHTHPEGFEKHSPQDDREEVPLFRTAYNRIHNDTPHVSLVFTGSGISSARVWREDGTVAPVERVRIIGNRFRFLFAERASRSVPEFFDRQVRAFGADLQQLLGRLTVGVVGAGGTGSAVIQQLTRLGVGELLIADGEAFDASNINRLYGSRVVDQDIPKVKIAERAIADIGLGTRLTILPRPITFRSAFAQLRDCDVIFGCTDEEWGRSLLTRAAIYYGIPVFDVGVKIDSAEGTILSIQGRVTPLMPGAPCLFCRGRITAERIGIESQRETSTELAAERVRDGYAPELEDPAPSVIPFTTTVAASAISEFLNRLTGFMGDVGRGSELLHLFDAAAIRRNTKASKSDCFCAPRELWMRGDVRPLLDTSWRSE